MELEGYDRGTIETYLSATFTVAFESAYRGRPQLAPRFVGLLRRSSCDSDPNPRSGHVAHTGKVKFTFADGTEETYEAGDAVLTSAPLGHVRESLLRPRT